jgi:hypothetical protein
VNETCDNLLAGSAFSQQQYRNINTGHHPHLSADSVHRLARRNKKNVFADLFCLHRHCGGCDLLVVNRQTAANDGTEFPLMKWLGKIVLSPQADCLNDGPRITDTREHHNSQARPDIMKLLKGL